MTDWAKWKLVPVEPPQSLIDEACHEHDPGVMCWAKLNFAERWKRVLTTAPSAPIVDVSRDSCRDVYAVYEQNNGDDGNRVYSGRRMIAAVQQVLGPRLKWSRARNWRGRWRRRIWRGTGRAISQILPDLMQSFRIMTGRTATPARR